MTIRLLSGSLLAVLLAAGVAGPAGADVVTGTSGPDVLTGTAGPDTLRGLAGADTLYGKAGPDTLRSGKDERRDLLYGGRGADHIYARGLDFVYAGRGNDTIRVSHLDPWTQAGLHTRVDCGPGEDTVIGPVTWLTLHGCEHLVRVDAR